MARAGGAVIWGAERLCAIAAIGAAIAAPAAAEDPFRIQSIAMSGRVVQADLVDLDGDARADLLCMRAEGMPPDEHRTIHVFYQRPDRSFSDTPDWSAPLPAGTAAYDLAELDARPGAELILLRRDRLTLLSLFERRPAFRDLAIGPEPTIAVVEDERGVDRLALARSGLAEEPRLLVPGLGTTTVLAPSGEVLGRLDVGARANYYLPKRPGALVSESEVEIYLDDPRLSVGDVDGDGRGDIVSANRHEVRVFLQDAHGHFPDHASRRIALGLLAPEDHVRDSGMVRVDGIDLDGDRRLDLLIAKSVGSLFSAATQTTVSIHLNHDGNWNLARPDQQFQAAGGLTGNVVIDLDGDGRDELIEARVSVGVLEVVEMLVTRAIEAEVSIYRRGERTPFEARPAQHWKIDVPFSFKTFRSLGFIPTLEEDFNGDGVKDLLGSGAGDRLEVRLGGAGSNYQTVQASQALDTGGRIRFGDLDGDHLTDFVLYDPRRPGVPVKIGVNRGILPRAPRKR
ncbi:MAG TPA: VCBS repeat-containing protein [Myxococcota bacterium]|nr:VCBS repeat-containing protein [Myxococcota bacterium]